MKIFNHTGKSKTVSMFIKHLPFLFLLKVLLLLLILNTLPEPEAMGQATIIEKTDVPVIAYDEIPVRVMIEGYNIFYIDAVYGNNKLLLVNIEDLFSILNIPCIAGKNGNSVSGFIEKESQTYSIDFETSQIKVGDKTIDAKNGIIKEAGALYIETSLFDEAFGITLSFNYRALTVLLKSDFELPVLKQMRIAKQRNNLSKIKGEVIADTIVNRNYHLLKFGAVDWSAASFQRWNDATDHNFSLGIGSELLYGEADFVVNYYNRYKFNNRQLYYIWRWVDNDKSIIKQAQVGKISNQTISFINSPIVGAVVRNSPTTIRKATGYYTINEFTEPNWNVELYINNVLVDFTTADASGSYQFKVPIVYGYTTLRLKFYGPLGEERTEERTINVPYTVMPAKEFEYGLSGGIVEDSLSSRFGRAEFNYGVNRILTMGGGLEYLSSITNGAYIPFATATFQPFSRLTINAEYAHGVRTKAILNYYIRKDILLEIDYAKYVEGQLATRFNAPEERKVRLSLPLRYKKITGFTRLDFMQRVYKTFDYNQGNLMISAYHKQFSVSSATKLNWIGNMPFYAFSDLALSYRLRNGITLRPSAQYNINEGNLTTIKLAIEKYIPKGNFSISYERNRMYNDHFISVNFRYDLPFARTNISASQSRGNMSTSESLQGSLAFGSGNDYVHKSNYSSVGKGGISLYPFLDLNNNGIFDAGEKMVRISAVSIMGGKAIFSEKDSIVRIPDLNPFTDYLIEFKDIDLENISWRFKKKTYQVLIDPNQFKRIDVPVISVGEIIGMAYLNMENSLKAMKRIQVKIYEKNSNKVVAETLSEPDGYINYIGLEPGEYIARIDPEQLAKLNMVSSPELIPVKISKSFDGDIVNGIDFTLSPAKEPVPVQTKINFPLETDTAVVRIPQDSTKIKTSESTNIKISIIEHEGYELQVGAFKVKSNAFAAYKKLPLISEKPKIIIYEDSYYKVRISGFENRGLARQMALKLPALGFNEFYFPVTKPSNSLQVGEYKIENDALIARDEWTKRTEKPFIIIYENELYKVRIGGFQWQKQALEFLPKFTERN